MYGFDSARNEQIVEALTPEFSEVFSAIAFIC